MTPRTIKPELAHNHKLWDLGEETGLPVFQAYALLPCHCDDEGRFEWDERFLKIMILPWWDGEIGKVLEALVSSGLVSRHKFDGGYYGEIRDWEGLQGKKSKSTPRMKTRESTEYPAPTTTIQPMSSPETAASVPLQEWAEWIVLHPHDAQWCEPQKRPELIEVACAMVGEAASRRLGTPQSDSGVRRIVELFSAGYTVEQLVAVAATLPYNEWWANGKRGLASLTNEVVRRQLKTIDSWGELNLEDLVDRAKAEAGRGPNRPKRIIADRDLT